MSEQPLGCPFCGCKTITVTEGSTFRWAIGECDNCGGAGLVVLEEGMKMAEKEFGITS